MLYQMIKQKIILNFLVLIISASTSLAQNGDPIGWASQNGGTTGGKGGDTTIVTSRHELLSVIGSADSKIILVKDTVELDLYERVVVGPNTSLVGMADGGTLLGGGLEVTGDNVVIQNLRITGSYDGDWEGKTHSTDAITITSSNVWIDHCDVSASADGLIDVRAGNNSAGDFITISWTRFSNHNKVMLFGSSDDEIENRGKLRITIHHCWFDGYPERGVNQRMPRIRFGDVHLFNNFFDDVDSYCIAARFESDVVVEKNFFRNARNPHTVLDQGLGIKDPELVAFGNLYEFSGGDKIVSGQAFNPGDFYEYQPDTVALLPMQIMNGAGVFNDLSNAPPIAGTDTIELEDDQRSVIIDALANVTDPDKDDLRLSLIINQDQLSGLGQIKDNMINYVAGGSDPIEDTIQFQVVDLQGGVDTGYIFISTFNATTPVFDLQASRENALSLLPNPADQYAIIQYFDEGVSQIFFRVIDAQGKILIHQTVGQKTFHPGNHRYYLDLSHFPSGVYWIQVANATRKQSQKFSIIR